MQKTLGAAVSRGTIRQRLQAGGRLLSALVSITLEDSLQTADSMNARGYGLPGKTRSRKIRFALRDGVLLAASLGELVCFLLLFGMGKLDFYYFPALAGAEWTTAVAAFFLATCFYFLIPIFIFIGEEIQWLFLKSKISRLLSQNAGAGAKGDFLFPGGGRAFPFERRVGFRQNHPFAPAEAGDRSLWQKAGSRLV